MNHQLPFASSSSKGAYEKIRPEDQLSNNDEEQPVYIDYGVHRTRARYTAIVTFMNVVLFLTSVLIAVRTSWRSNEMDINTAIRQTSAFSPVLEDMNVRYKDIKFNGSFYPPKHPSLTRLPPGDPDGEAFWEYFEVLKFFPISRDDVHRLGKDPATAVRFPNDAFGFGDDAFVAALDVPHKIHCLNELRKMAFMTYPGDGGGSSTNETTATKSGARGNVDPLFYKDRTFDELWWSHLRHCTDALAQELLCANSDVLTYNFRDTQTFAFPDFSINRKCRDLSQLLDYAEERMVDEETYSRNVRYSADGPTRLLPMDRRHYELYGFEGSTMFPNGRGFEEYFETHESEA